MKTISLAIRQTLMQYYNINLDTINLQSKCFQLHDSTNVQRLEIIQYTWFEH